MFICTVNNSDKTLGHLFYVFTFMVPKCKIMTRFPNILEEGYDYAIFFDLGKLVVC